MTFLGYRIGRNFRAEGRGAYIGTRPSTDSVQNICRTISDLTARRHGSLPAETVVERLNRTLSGWANYFRLGQVSPNGIHLTSFFAIHLRIRSPDGMLALRFGVLWFRLPRLSWSCRATG